MSNNAGLFTGIRALRTPEFVKILTDQYRLSRSQLLNYVDLRNMSGRTYFDIRPIQYIAQRIGAVDNRLQNLLTTPYRAVRHAVQADIDNNVTKRVGGKEVPVVVGDVIVDPDVRKEQSLARRRRETFPQIFGLQAKFPRLLINSMGQEALTLVGREMMKAVQYTIDLVLMAALYGFSLDNSGDLPVVGLGEYFTNSDGELVSGENYRLGFRDYDGVNVVTLSNRDKTFIRQSIPSENINQITLYDILKARAIIKNRGYLTQGATLVMMIHPETFALFFEDDDFMEAASYTDSGIVTTGEFNFIGGCIVVKTPHCSKDIVTVFSRGSVGAVMSEQPVLASDNELAEANSMRIGIWVTMGAAVLREEEILHITIRRS